MIKSTYGGRKRRMGKSVYGGRRRRVGRPRKRVVRRRVGRPIMRRGRGLFGKLFKSAVGALAPKAIDVLGGLAKDMVAKKMGGRRRRRVGGRRRQKSYIKPAGRVFPFALQYGGGKNYKAMRRGRGLLDWL